MTTIVMTLIDCRVLS